MSQYDELKQLAEAAKDDPSSPYIPCQVGFQNAATPEVVLALISENERLSGECEGCPMQVAEELRAEIAGLKTGYQAYEQVNAELKAEVEKLRKVAAELRQWTSCNHLHHEPHEQHAEEVHCKVLERIDAALGKGE